MTLGLHGRALPRELHPAAWWTWALGLAAAASRTTNPWLLLLILLVASLTVALRRTDAPWALSFRMYLYLGAFVVVLRVAFRVLFGGGYGTTVLLDLPQVPLPDWAAGITLLGPLTLESLLGGLYDGLRLATILVCVGAANSLANPRRLLAALPPALYEVGTALVIAVSLFPQLAESVQRVRQARRLRGEPGKGIGALRRIMVPVLEDALERSLSLAESMDARGYGRSGAQSSGSRRTTGALLIGALVGLCVGTYAFLDATAPRALAWPMLVLGLLLALGGFLAAGRRVTRTRYRPDHWHLPDVLTALSGVAAGVLMTLAAHARPEVALTDPALPPTLSVLALLAVVVALVPVLVTPEPPREHDVEPAAPARDLRGRWPVIEWREVSFGYLPDVPVLREVSFAAEDAELLLLAGRTGSGKSTLLRTVNGLVPGFSGGHLAGDVLVGGESIRGRAPRELAELVGYVGQDPAASFVTDRVEDELAYGMEQLGLAPQTMRRRVEETLDLLGIADLRTRSVRGLSGGQQQRVAIGAVLTMHPRVLVLDEPTSALDPTAAEDVLSTLARLVEDLGLTVLVAEHRLERVVPFADRLLVLEHGRVRGGDTAAMLQTSPVAPPVVELGRLAGWQPLPVSVREARRRTPALLGALGAPPGRRPRPAGECVLRAEDVVVRYGGTVAVRHVSLSVAAGQVVALMGRNGSGKSSLLWALQGSGRRDGGVVQATGTVVAGAVPAPVDPATLPADQARALVGLVPQTAADLLYLESVAEECATADRQSAAVPGTCAAILERLAPAIAPDRHPRDLSEGQRLALVLAIVLTARPRVLALDEPTRGLDYAGKAALAAAIADLAAEGHGLVVASHDVEFVAQVADQVVVMAAGEVVSAGLTDRVLAESPAFAPQMSKILGDGWLTVDQVREALV